MKRTTILADEDLLAEAKALASEQGISFTALVQQALRNYIEMYRLPRHLSFVGSVNSGYSLTPEEMDRILGDDIDPIEGWSPPPAPAAEPDRTRDRSASSA